MASDRYLLPTVAGEQDRIDPGAQRDQTAVAKGYRYTGLFGHIDILNCLL